MDFRVFLEPQQGATYHDQLAVAQAAESLGFSALFRSDHYQAMSGDGLPGPTDSWVTLAGIARETSSIRLGTLVTSATFRHPGPLAISVAQVDEMSAGRVEFGIGAGWFEAEHRAYAIPFPGLGERFDRLEEQLDIITGMWATPVGARFDYSGTHYTVTDSPALPKPAQRPHPPIIIGGGGPKRTPALAARFAAEFNLAFRRWISCRFSWAEFATPPNTRAAPPTTSSIRRHSRFAGEEMRLRSHSVRTRSAVTSTSFAPTHPCVARRLRSSTGSGRSPKPVSSGCICNCSTPMTLITWNCSRPRSCGRSEDTTRIATRGAQ